MKTLPFSIYAVVLLLTGSLSAGLGILLPALWFLTPLGLACVLYVVWFKTETVAGAALCGFLLGCATGGAGVWWMWDMIPIQAPPGIPESTQLIVTSLVWGMTALLAGVTTALATLVVFLLRRNMSIGLITGIVFVVETALRMWAYALYSYSPDSLFGPHFSQTGLGYPLAENPYLLQLAYPFGVYGLTFALVMISVALVSVVRAVEKRKFGFRSLIVFLVLVPLLLTPLVLPYIRPTDTDTVHAAIVSVGSTESTTTPESERLMPLLKSVYGKTDMLIFPEGTTLDGLFPETTVRKALLTRLFGGPEGMVIGSHYERDEKGKNYSRIQYVNQNDEIVAHYTKLFLMPEAEYYPLIARPLFALAGNEHMNSYIETAGKRLTRGSGLVVAPFKTHLIGGLLCSEIMSPHFYRELTTTYHADILVNLSDPEWFHSSRSLHDKTLQLAKVHAVQNRTYFLLASRGTSSLAISPEGTLIAQSAWNSDDILLVTLTLPKR